MVKSKKSGGGRKGKAVPIKAKAKVVEEEEFEEEEEQGSQDNGKDDHDDESSEPEENDAPPAKRSKTTTPAKKGKAGPASSKKGKTEPAASKKGKAGPASKTKQPAAANKGRPKKSVEKPAAVDSESDDADSDTDYEVDSLLDVKYNRNGTKEFLVKWIGYPKSQATWEPEGNLNCPEKLEAFSKKLDADNLPRSRRISPTNNNLAAKKIRVKEGRVEKLANNQLSKFSLNRFSVSGFSLLPRSSRKITRNLKLTALFSATVLSFGAVTYINYDFIKQFSWASVQPQLFNLFQTCQIIFRNFFHSA
ncbi:uncharacterized protein LOC110845744 isoform X2 [Folsomia candida]|uniref:uncharacterized protein LOC110845744 isoform X2 n=1 Tax=Folsomia candida TaxID=158441 RepID=UPI000B8F2730|nr:uncharacterized protein LOC110845744 isoform X2 [Folsomia candida]